MELETENKNDFIEKDNSTIFVPVGKKPEDFIPVGREDDYIRDNCGNLWKKEDFYKMKKSWDK